MKKNSRRLPRNQLPFCEGEIDDVVGDLFICLELFLRFFVFLVDLGGWRGYL